MGFFTKLFSKKKTEPATSDNFTQEAKALENEQQHSKSAKLIRINIEEFIWKYMPGGSIEEDLFCQLLNEQLKGMDYAFITTDELSACEKALYKHLKQEEELYRTAELNNLGIEAEKEGRIADAIKIYEENIYSSHPAHHSFYRLGVLYRKAKDKENEIKVLKRAVELFGPDSGYSTDLDNILNPKEPVYPTSSDPCTNIENPLGGQLEAAKRIFPEFEFYTQINEPPKFSIQGSEYLKIKNAFDELETEALCHEAQYRFDLAAPIYERLIAEQSPFVRHYDRLIAIYFKAKLKNDLARVLKTGIDNLSSLRKEQLEYVALLARKNNRLEFFQERVSNSKKVTYYNGVFDLYNPYPCILKWEKRLSNLKL